ncbi:MAG: hypothetical protein JO175_05225 [Candidatus Eremiobacteraeota bacterium]|nr:hypothetical protein [Candidatus Eremiobacteraeota bacterium]
MWPMLQTIASIGTLLVFVISAFLALRQFRANAHTNQLAALQAVSNHYSGTDFQDWFDFAMNKLPDKWKDPAFREGLRADPIDRKAHPEVMLANWYEDIGIQIKYGVVDEEPVIEYLRDGPTRAWHALKPMIEFYRQIWGAWNFRNFEHLARRSHAFYSCLDSRRDSSSRPVSS